ncbi:pyridoxal phosphate homeostasis protein-like [Oscarella lobularis]|uniref:pyridoxal phosphate homeostasis protein-like n=1 Tax=Oscarella lobularis TaxID=121494 RepID=UPI003313400F
MSGKIVSRLSAVLDRVKAAAGSRESVPRVVAVSKLKPIEAILEAYEAGQRHFGENYVQELAEKAKDERVQLKAPDIKWHFIGHLQKNKCNLLLETANLWMIETVDSVKLANALNQTLVRKAKKSVNVFVQVNTSGEDSKNGCSPDSCVDLVEHIVKNCHLLDFRGLMTIGQWGHDYSQGSNPDFETLSQCRVSVSEKLSLPLDAIELSMGMSGDFEEAIAAGSTNVRVGTSIFGEREKKQ